MSGAFARLSGEGSVLMTTNWRPLAVLHLLTGAPVAVLRVVEAASVRALQRLSAEIAYRDGAQLDWLR
jgi:hypothetical protein